MGLSNNPWGGGVSDTELKTVGDNFPNLWKSMNEGRESQCFQKIF